MKLRCYTTSNVLFLILVCLMFASFVQAQSLGQAAFVEHQRSISTLIGMQIPPTPRPVCPPSFRARHVAPALQIQETSSLVNSLLIMNTCRRTEACIRLQTQTNINRAIIFNWSTVGLHTP